MERAVVLVIEDDGEEFRSALEWLARETTLVRAADVNVAMGRLVEGLAPAVIVVAQNAPGQYTHAVLEALRIAAPLATIVMLLGSWCEGEARTGKPWAGAVRVYAHQFIARMAAELERWKATGRMSWSLPFTATEEDRLLGRDKSARSTRSGDGATVLVIARNADAGSALTDTCRSLGYDARWVRESVGDSVERPQIFVFDCPAGLEASADALVAVRDRFPETPLVALLGFPRPEDCERASSLGATSVLSKPYRVQELGWTLTNLAARK